MPQLRKANRALNNNLKSLAFARAAKLMQQHDILFIKNTATMTTNKQTLPKINYRLASNVKPSQSFGPMMRCNLRQYSKSVISIISFLMNVSVCSSDIQYHTVNVHTTQIAKCGWINIETCIESGQKALFEVLYVFNPFCVFNLN